MRKTVSVLLVTVLTLMLLVNVAVAGAHSPIRPMIANWHSPRVFTLTDLATFESRWVTVMGDSSPIRPF